MFWTSRESLGKLNIGLMDLMAAPTVLKELLIEYFIFLIKKNTE